MKRRGFWGVCLFLFLLMACQREISFEASQPSAGSLARDSSGNCELITAGGTFTAAKPLTDSNFLSVTVNVTTPGPYTIVTDTVNGYSFSATGSFTATGKTAVRLRATGRPILAGPNQLTVRYSSSFCIATIIIGRNPLDAAAFSLTGAPGSCVNAGVQGSYVKGYPLDTTAKVLLQVIVNTPGTYSISTDTVNGYSFSGSGVFTATGPQVVVLPASGKPAAAGTNAFSVKGSPAGCTFSVTVASPLVIAGTDYFPLTYPSFWVYDRDDFAADSVKRTVTDSIAQNGKVYKKVNEYFPFAGGPLYFRKAGTDYFEYGRVEKYTSSFSYAPAVNDDIPFLKENLTTGATWLSPEYTGTASFGQTILFRYRFQCIDAAAAVTVNGNTFGNVYRIRMLPEIASVGNNWGSTFETYEFDYAKGVGLIFSTKTLNGFTQYRQTLRRWMVY